jgi:hypothetical protein
METKEPRKKNQFEKSNNEAEKTRIEVNNSLGCCISIYDSGSTLINTISARNDYLAKQKKECLANSAEK